MVMQTSVLTSQEPCVHSKLNILSFTHAQFVSNLYELIYSVEEDIFNEYL